MNKQEVAEMLGVSVRAIERYLAAGKLNCTYEDADRGGKRAVFARGDVLKLKKAMAQTNGNLRHANGRHSDTSLARQGVTVSGQFSQLAEHLARLAHLYPSNPVRTTEKLTLTLAEAAALSGLSVAFLRDAIREGKLKGIRGAGRGWRVRRGDLEGFVEGL